MTKQQAQQSSKTILMVSPTHFELNTQAVNDNYFMNVPKDSTDVPKQGALEFMTYYNALKEAGVKVILMDSNDGVDTPDCIFPNNWFSTHNKEETGKDHDTLVLYPMLHLNRRLERRPKIIEYLKNTLDNVETIDLSVHEQENNFLEGTGSLVLDRVNRVAYVAISQRSHKLLAMEWAEKLGYQLVAFTATDSHGKIIYHTNVMMAICSGFAICCLESVEDIVEQRHLIDSLTKHHTLITITRDQVNAFCGNVIEVQSQDGKKHFVCSKTAFDAFTPEQRTVIGKFSDGGFITKDIPTIQYIGGGGIRCMIAEVFP
ncbi:hypothetical protein DFA_10920 [Cavenderia fasciculata]|uniref:Amidinotransferase n=1 Tax=Cavenderia fasciculata TaxID=261658 RepID=F4QBS4_CACFS|nr:uncharacterized protein DFA_10920 [Cavenderia fasciculata]EGG14662.1 hypothetical protein DFA_10920 [Cavenderia fasciculata]|eukprot:XP_004351170.1 hypothetical protein DFA_10920 [Cavenderia fasciculata]